MTLLLHASTQPFRARLERLVAELGRLALDGATMAADELAAHLHARPGEPIPDALVAAAVRVAAMAPTGHAALAAAADVSEHVAANPPTPALADEADHHRMTDDGAPATAP